MILILALSALMLSACGRKNALVPVGPSPTINEETGEVTAPASENEDKPFILDALL